MAKGKKKTVVETVTEKISDAVDRVIHPADHKPEGETPAASEKEETAKPYQSDMVSHKKFDKFK